MSNIEFVLNYMNVTMDPIGSCVAAPQFNNRKMAVMEKNNPTSSPDQCPCPQHRQ